MHATPRLRAALATAALSLSLGSCSSDDPEPNVATTPSESSSSATPSPSDTAAPEDEVGFIELFYERVTSAIASGEPSEFLDLTDPACVNCQTLANNLRTAYRNGGSIADGEWTVQSAEPDPGEAEDVWQVRVRTARERWLDASGEVVKTVAPSLQTVAMQLRQEDGEWRVKELKLQ